MCGKSDGEFMPVHWQIDHATRTVMVDAEGVLGLRDIEDLLDTMERVGTLSYRKLFNMTRSSTAMSKDELITLCDRIRKESDVGRRGPAAIVATTDEHYVQARLFEAMAKSIPHQRVKVFRELQAASDWLSAEPAEPWRHAWMENHEME
jgi:hypothetical protein